MPGHTKKERAKKKKSKPLTRAAVKKAIAETSPLKFLSKFGRVETNPRKNQGAVGLINKNQLKQLRTIGDVQDNRKK